MVLLSVGELTLEVEEIEVDDLVPEGARVCEYPEAPMLDDGREVGFEDPGPVCEWE